MAQLPRSLSALVALDVAKAKDSVKHPILINTLVSLNAPMYGAVWAQEFLTGRNVFGVDGRLSSHFFPQLRRVPQGSVL